MIFRRLWIQKLLISLLILHGIDSIYAQSETAKPSHNWNSPSEVVKKIKKKFSGIKSYSAEFRMQTLQNKKTTNMKGSCYYKAPGKIRFDFKEPDGDAIVSDGKTLWIYLKRIGAVGKQDLDVKKGNNAAPVFQAGTSEGLLRLFRKYHYKFDSTEQPQHGKDGKNYFVLSLEQREKIGGYENIILYVDAESYIITKAIASDNRGKVTTVEFINMALGTELEDGFFNYHISGNAKIVNNPLVSEN